MKHIFLISTSLFLLLCSACSKQDVGVFDGAEWIGTDETVLYAPYQAEFELSYDMTLNEGAQKAAFLLGGDDERVLSKNLNHLGTENKEGEVYVAIEVDAEPLAEGKNAVLRVIRRGYTNNDGNGKVITEKEIPGLAFTNEGKSLHVDVSVITSSMSIAVGDTLFRNIVVSPLEKTGGDYFAFPVLGEIGSIGNAKFENIEVRNVRTPKGLLYTGGWTTEQPLFDPSHLGMPNLFSSLTIKDKPVESATLVATARGVYEMSINGNKVGEDFFAPGFTQYNKTHYYQTYDVKDMLKAGENEVSAVLGEGWWMGPIGFWANGVNHFGDRLSLLAKLTVKYADGEEYILATNDKDWKVSTDGTIRYSSRFNGEIIDGSKVSARENATNAKVMSLDGHVAEEYSQNTPAVNDYSEYQLLPQPDESVKIRKVLTAVSVEEPRPGVYVYDMGQNMAGLPEITFQGLKEGQKIRMRYAEVKYPDMKEYSLNKGMVMMENIRAAFAQDIYLAAGKETETFAPHFTLHGYRFVEISGIDEALPLDAVKGRVLSSIELVSDFECSNPLVNRLWKNIQWSSLGNFISIPTDCPQRNERLGWGGDINLFSRTATYMADSYEFLRRHMRNLRDTQTPEGQFLDIAPVGGGFGGFLWGSAGITVAYEAWRQTGRTEILEEHYDAMTRYIHYVQNNYFDKENGILFQTHGWGGLGDWLNLEYNKLDNSILYESYYIFDLQCLLEMAKALGKDADAKEYDRIIEERKDFFVNTYVDKVSGKMIWSAFDPTRQGQLCDYEASYVLPLAFGIIDDADLKHKMLNNLVATIERENSTDEGVKCPPYSLMTGFISTAWINKALTDNGRADVAYRLLQSTTYPSWLYPVTQGATTIWERLNSYNDFEGFGGNNSMNSFNHYSFGAVGQWMMSRILGIERDDESAGFKHFVLRPVPDPTNEMTFAKGHYKSEQGMISAGWERMDDGSVKYNFSIPKGCSATLIVEGKDPKEFTEGTHEVIL